MSRDTISYIVFGIVLLFALIFDLGLLSKKNKTVTIKQALLQTIFWVSLGLAFFVFMWFENGKTHALEYISAYLMEWSLSIDNIFVFILIFTSFSVKEQYYSRVLLLGILMAIIFRVIFITVGVALVNRFEWLLYIFGAFLVYTGFHMFTSKDDEAFDPETSKAYKFVKRIFPVTNSDGNGKLWIRENGKRLYTTLFVVVMMLASIDLVFALDSIPAVMGISRDKMVIYTSNIFAVLGLRSLFFLLKGAVAKFDYLQEGIAIVLVFIGLKMIGAHWLEQWLSPTTLVFISLGVIIICITGSVLLSIRKNNREKQLQA
ncbi:TerC/Alx family metal homeostasis membrane protein [Parafilimonas terrae]|jgi:tellurite resistance protein TerC|uniref:Tellurite resistance protein TerC n=1 Tax=Parafilimonas terrae TaxID=1465490 RepID=A0A1I5XKB3_9BACT|nr:TerC/Alx family metal homeostasis membrane protein [Parafilimonas terrae]SFQ32360.1 tellurite resistance protein TerC [Parafilimonas terrae]